MMILWENWTLISNEKVEGDGCVRVVGSDPELEIGLFNHSSRVGGWKYKTEYLCSLSLDIIPAKKKSETMNALKTNQNIAYPRIEN